MRNKMKKLLISLILLMVPQLVLGSTFATDKSTATVDIGGSVNVKLNVAGITGRIDITSSDKNVCTISFNHKPSNAGTVEEGKKLKVVYGTEVVTGSDYIGITVKGVSSGNCTVTFIPTDVTDYATDAEVSGNKTVNVTVNAAKSNIATLDSLTVEGQTLDGFSSSKTDYTISEAFASDKTKVSIAATATDGSKAKISGAGNIDLKYGTNTYTVKVTAEDGKTTKSYTIKMTRTDNRNTDNTLRICTLEGVDGLSFDSNTTSYNLTGTVGTIVKVQCELNDEKAKFGSNKGNRSVTLKAGSNKIEVVAEAENGKTKTYVFNVTVPEGNKSTDATLANITISNVQEFYFNPNTYEYDLTVYNTVTSVDVTATLNDTKASFNGFKNGNFKLNDDVTEIVIKTVAETKSVTQEYKIRITKIEEPVVKSAEVTGVDNFDVNTKVYNVTINKGDVINFNFNLKDGYVASVSGNENLSNGSVITVEIKLGDEVVDTYTYNVQMEEEKEEVPTKVVEDTFFNSDTFKYICIGFLILGIILFVLAFLYYKKSLKSKEEVI